MGKKIEFIAGYHEWQVIVDGNHIHSFDDFSDEIKENMTAEQVDDLVDDLIYGWQMSFENDCDSLDEGEECPITPIWETHGAELRQVMFNAICEHYGIECELFEQQKKLLRNIADAANYFENRHGKKISMDWLLESCERSIKEIETEQKYIKENRK